MSAFVAIWNMDGAPVDPALLRELTQFLSVAGPDAQETWMDGSVGLGHAMFRTTYEAREERQPCTLDGRTWIAADARIDARADLIRKLEGRGIKASLSEPDSHLILHAYAAWGEQCVEHLLGDFAFVIWDAENRRVFCARDHLGIKPFFYSIVGRTLIVSTSLVCVRRHPAVSAELNDLAIADFLLFDLNQDQATTSFRDIQRLVPGHVLKVQAGELRSERYWTLPIEDPILYRDRRQYVEHFRELLDTAIRDRVRCDWVGVYMSGGLDSAGMAACTHRIMRESGNSSMHAFTAVHTRLIVDDEREYAGLVAQKGGFPITFHEVDLTDEVTDLATTSEPVGVPWRVAAGRHYSRQIAAQGRVAFYGEGPDNALHYEWRPYMRYLRDSGKWTRLVSDPLHTMLAHRCLLWFPNIPGISRGRRLREAWQPQFPEWLNPNFVNGLRLEERWKQGASPAQPLVSHPLRPRGYQSFMASHLWQQLFASFDAGETGVLLEGRHPYLDLRVLRFMLAVPALPWCRNKHLIRLAFRGILPERVLQRPKTPLRGDPESERARRGGVPPLSPQASALDRYVEVSKVPRNIWEHPTDLRMNLRPVGLNWWLQSIAAQ